jgi:hypothetical protein
VGSSVGLPDGAIETVGAALTLIDMVVLVAKLGAALGIHDVITDGRILDGALETVGAVLVDGVVLGALDVVVLGTMLRAAL